MPVYGEKLGIDLDRVGATIVEVGGKRNLKEFAELAISFGIPTCVVYDKNSSDFRKNNDEEDAYNAGLDALATKCGAVRVWQLENAFEDVLRNTVGTISTSDYVRPTPTTPRQRVRFTRA
jgi:putative ATP-dependent endonuclease of OLD family